MNSPDHKKTYRNETENYDQLIVHEDFQGNILRELERIHPAKGVDILDLGAGTGRLERLIAGQAKSMTALDLSPTMLQVAKQHQSQPEMRPCFFAAADHRALPLREMSFDLILSGWSICYLVDWYPDTWQHELGRAFDEIKRVIRPGGRVILLETQGTGFETPHPPPHLNQYFGYLAKTGFDFSWVRTDYAFSSLEEAERTCCFFFGDELAARVRENDWITVPECTGFWTKILK